MTLVTSNGWTKGIHLFCFKMQFFCFISLLAQDSLSHLGVCVCVCSGVEANLITKPIKCKRAIATRGRTPLISHFSSLMSWWVTLHIHQQRPQTHLSQQTQCHTKYSGFYSYFFICYRHSHNNRKETTVSGRKKSQKQRLFTFVNIITFSRSLSFPTISSPSFSLLVFLF